MEKYDHIIDLLEKDILSEQDRNFLKNAIQDKEIDKFVKLYNSLKSGIADSDHLSPEILASYIMMEHGDEPEIKYVSLLNDKIRHHISKCKNCKIDYEYFRNEYPELQDHISKHLTAKSENIKESKTAISSFIFKSFSGFKYAVASILIISLAYTGLLITSDFVTPEYQKNIFSENGEYLTTRGRTSILFQQALDASDKGNLGEAIKYLNEDILINKKESSIFYSHFILGLVYLKDAESDILGMFNSFDSKKVSMAVENLNLAIQKNNSGNYKNINLDAHYYLGRSFLLLDDKKSARENLEVVIEEKGKFYKKAEELINSLENN